MIEVIKIEYEVLKGKDWLQWKATIAAKNAQDAEKLILKLNKNQDFRITSVSTLGNLHAVTDEAVKWVLKAEENKKLNVEGKRRGRPKKIEVE